RQSGGCERERFSQAYFISQEQANRAIEALVSQAFSQKALLPRLKLLPFTVSGGLDKRSGCNAFVVVELSKLHFPSITAPMDFADHCARQGFGSIPEEIKLFLDPGYTFGRIVFPQNFVVALPTATRFV